jgi:hypothetical protein
MNYVNNIATMTLVLALISACGNGQSNDDASTKGATDNGISNYPRTLTVAEAADLPECNEDLEQQLIYVRSDEQFKYCNSGDWEDIDLKGKDGESVAGKDGKDGTNGVDGLKVSSNRLISIYGTDICTGVDDEACWFEGGQIVKYSDGSVFILGMFRFGYVDAGDTDTDQISTSFLFPSNAVDGYVRLSSFVHRGTTYRSLYLTYNLPTDTLRLVYDTDGDGFETTDTVITTLSTTSW